MSTRIKDLSTKDRFKLSSTDSRVFELASVHHDRRTAEALDTFSGEIATFGFSLPVIKVVVQNEVVTTPAPEPVIASSSAIDLRDSADKGWFLVLDEKSDYYAEWYRLDSSKVCSDLNKDRWPQCQCLDGKSTAVISGLTKVLLASTTGAAMTAGDLKVGDEFECTDQGMREVFGDGKMKCLGVDAFRIQAESVSDPKRGTIRTYLPLTISVKKLGAEPSIETPTGIAEVAAGTTPIPQEAVIDGSVALGSLTDRDTFSFIDPSDKPDGPLSDLFQVEGSIGELGVKCRDDEYGYGKPSYIIDKSVRVIKKDKPGYSHHGYHHHGSSYAGAASTDPVAPTGPIVNINILAVGDEFIEAYPISNGERRSGTVTGSTSSPYMVSVKYSGKDDVGTVEVSPSKSVILTKKGEDIIKDTAVYVSVNSLPVGAEIKVAMVHVVPRHAAGAHLKILKLSDNGLVKCAYVSTGTEIELYSNTKVKLIKHEASKPVAASTKPNTIQLSNLTADTWFQIPSDSMMESHRGGIFRLVTTGSQTVKAINEIMNTIMSFPANSHVIPLGDMPPKAEAVVLKSEDTKHLYEIPAGSWFEMVYTEDDQLKPWAGEWFKMIQSCTVSDTWAKAETTDGNPISFNPVCKAKIIASSDVEAKPKKTEPEPIKSREYSYAVPALTKAKNLMPGDKYAPIWGPNSVRTAIKIEGSQVNSKNDREDLFVNVDTLVIMLESPTNHSVPREYVDVYRMPPDFWFVTRPDAQGKRNYYKLFPAAGDIVGGSVMACVDHNGKTVHVDRNAQVTIVSEEVVNRHEDPVITKVEEPRDPVTPVVQRMMPLREVAADTLVLIDLKHQSCGNSRNIVRVTGKTAGFNSIEIEDIVTGVMIDRPSEQLVTPINAAARDDRINELLLQMAEVALKLQDEGVSVVTFARVYAPLSGINEIDPELYLQNSIQPETDVASYKTQVFSAMSEIMSEWADSWTTSHRMKSSGAPSVTSVVENLVAVAAEHAIYDEEIDD